MSEPPEDNVHQIWTEADLNAALSALHTNVRTDDDVLAIARADLMARAANNSQGEQMTTTTDREPVTAGEPQRRRRKFGRWIAAAAAVAAGLILPTLRVADHPPQAAANAATILNQAAARTIDVKDPVIGPGQYLYVATHDLQVVVSHVGSKSVGYEYDFQSETWVPKDRTQTWLQRTTSRDYRWIPGDETAAKGAGMVLPKEGSEPPQEYRAKCGDFFQPPSPVNGSNPVYKQCEQPGTWIHPNEEFLAGLPRDSQQLLDRLNNDIAAESRRGKSSDGAVVAYVGVVLQTGLIPADLRAAMYKTLALLPGLVVTDRVANLDGKTGTAMGVPTDTHRVDIIIDPEDGQYIGNRIIGDDGKVAATSSVASGVADTIGVKPAG